MNPLSAIYGAATAARNAAYDRRVLKPARLSRPVISIGNICVGGTGKTPFTIAFGEALAAKGVWIDVLSRGYRRRSSSAAEVRADGWPEDCGDEPLLIARRLRCPVFVAPERYRAGKLAEEKYAELPGVAVHLLDDGFQHRQLHRDFDIVLLSRDDLDASLLPRGRLREPLSSLNRSDAIVVDEDFDGELPGALKKPLWRVKRTMEVPALTAPAIAFCGIARPQRFFTGLRQHGVDVREEIAFRDHHRYTQRDIGRLLAIQRRIPGSRFISTEKDAINLAGLAPQLDAVIVPLRTEIQDAERFTSVVLGTIAQRRGCPA